MKVDSGGSQYLGILDPQQPDRPIQRLGRGLLNGLKPEEVGNTTGALRRPFLSPDGEWIAEAMAPPGGRPDVFAFRSDGSDTVRLTTNPDDDLPRAWFPDGRALLITSGVGSGTTQYAYHLFVATLDGRAPRPITPDALRDTWWFASSAAVSPEGTRIATFVQGARGGLWVMDADGRNATRLQNLEQPATSLAFSPDGGRLAFLENSGNRLIIVSPDSAFTAAQDLPGTAMPHTLLWSADGREVLFSAAIDGNTEVFGVPRDGSKVRRITYSNASEALAVRLGNQPPYVDQVEIIASAAARTLLVGDSVSLVAAARAPDGTVLRGTPLHLGCLSREVCTVRNGWLHGRTEGRTSLIASAGGWRADTVSVQVLDATPKLDLAEGWEGGIDATRWKMFGDPAPLIVPHAGRSGSEGFQANGDGEWDSGVVSRSVFSTHRGLSLEFWGRGAFDTPYPSWQWLRAGLTSDALTAFTRDGPSPTVPIQVTLENDTPGHSARLSTTGRAGPARSVLADLGAWHRYTLQVFPDGDAELWVDGRFLWREHDASPLPSDVRVVLYGRASAAPVIYDEVRVYEGILLR